MPAISVIVPVYNAEPCISRCIESILSQTYTDFELIIVDDGSPDASGKIADGYALQDNRITVIHKPNGGVSQARNCGLEVAVGEYITFVDGDDWVSENFLADMMKTDADMVVHTAVTLDENGNELYLPDFPYFETDRITPDEIARLLLESRLLWAWANRKKRSIIEKYHIRFDTDINYGEDTLFTIEYAVHCRSVILESVANYRYIRYKSRKTLADGITLERYDTVKKANRKISELLYPDDSAAAHRLFIQRMSVAYSEFLYIIKSKSKKERREICELLFSEEELRKIACTREDLPYSFFNKALAKKSYRLMQRGFRLSEQSYKISVTAKILLRKLLGHYGYEWLKKKLKKQTA